MSRPRGLSARVKLTLSYAGFLVFAGCLLLGVTWIFLIRNGSHLSIPALEDFGRVFIPGNFGPVVFVPAAILALLFLLAVGLVGGWFLAGRMLAPLARITSAARQASHGSLTHRIGLEGNDDEFRKLADAFDMMLAKLEAQVAEHQRFAANASHELRTPLAVMQTILEVASRDPSPDGREERLRAINARAIALTEALLLMSRADQRSFVREAVDLSLLAEQAAETLLPLSEKRGVIVETGGSVAIASGSPALLGQMVTNLLHNAIVHNRPEGGSAWVFTTAGSGSVELRVENTGDQIAPSLAATLTEPFRRGSDRIRSDQTGTGLGLAIVDSIVRAHDGTLDIGGRAGGGLRVTVGFAQLR